MAVCVGCSLEADPILLAMQQKCKEPLTAIDKDELARLMCCVWLHVRLHPIFQQIWQRF